MRGIELIGLLAGFFTTIEIVPQVWKTIRSKSTRDLAMQSLVMVVVGCVLWIVYGLAIKSPSIIATCSVSAVLYLILIFLKLKYDRKIKIGQSDLECFNYTCPNYGNNYCFARKELWETCKRRELR